MKTHYELLGLDSSADADAIKKAFRREIARYHPDKVIHLGAEFQALAATRAAELTSAYKTLTDPALRDEYNAGIAADQPLSQYGSPVAHSVPKAESAPPPVEDFPQPAAAGSTTRFASERADRDRILKRAIAGRVLSVVERLYGKVDTPAVRGFDLAIVPLAKPRFLGTTPPRVLVRVIETADGAAIADAHGAATRARVHSGKSPVVVLVFASHIAPQPELSRAYEANARSRKAPDGPVEVAVVVVKTGDWSCRVPNQCSAVVHKLATEICA